MSVVKNMFRLSDLQEITYALNSMREKFCKEGNHEYTVILNLASQTIKEYADVLANVNECVDIKDTDLIGKVKEVTKYYYNNHKQ